MSSVFGIVIVAHGGLAKEFLSAVEHVVGPQEGVRAISIGSDVQLDEMRSEIQSVADQVDVGHGAVVVADLMGASPANLAVQACAKENRAVLCGANVAMLVKLVRSRKQDMNVAIESAIETGKKHILTPAAIKAT